MAMSPKRIFLIDGLGALVTAFFLICILARFQTSFGMPKKSLYVLSSIAIFFSIYSLSCYWLLKRSMGTFLLLIAVANTLYCILTIILLEYYASSLTLLGFAYFICELAIILTLVVIEFKAARASKIMTYKDAL